MQSSEILDFLKLNPKIKFKFSYKFFSSLNNIQNRTIFFCKNLNYANIKKINSIKYGILIINKKSKNIKKNIIQIQNKNPKKSFFEIIEKFHPREKKIIAPKVGNKTIVHENVKIGNNVTIGKNCLIHTNVVIGDNVIIGNNCVIKSNSVIGQKGFGWITKNTKLQPIKHYGSVVLKNNVEIGCGNTIACGTLDSTVISSNNKLDDQVHIAHNCDLKDNNMICAGTIIGGSVKIGKNNFFGLNTTVKNGIIIGNNNFFGSASNVVSDKKNNKLIVGSPAKEIKKSNGIFDLKI